MKPVRLFNITLAAFTAAILFLAGTVSAQIDELYCPPGELSIIKEVNTRLVHYGDNIYYTLRVVNNRFESFEAIEVIDTLSPDAEYLDGSASDGGVYYYDSRTLNWSIPSLAPADTAILTFTLITAPYGYDTLVVLNRAHIVSPITQKSNWVITWIKPNIPPQAILDIEKAADKTSVYPGDTITYTLAASNTGEAAAFNIFVTDNIPEHSQIVPGSISSGGIYDAAHNQVRWLITELSTGSNVSLNFQVGVNIDAPVYTDIANIGIIIFPDSTVADTAVTTITPPPSPDLTLDKTVDLAEAYPGDTLTYTLFVRNQGDAPAFELSLIDQLPVEVAYIPGSATNGVVYDDANRQLTWTIPALEPEQGIELSFRAAILPEISAGTDIVNFALLTGPDTTFSDTVTTEVLFKPITRLTIDKSVDKRVTHQGDTLTYTLNIANSGNTVISPVDIRDSLPEYTEYLPGSVTGGGIFNYETIQFIWQFEAIEPGESHEVSFKVIELINPTELIFVENFAFTIIPQGIFSDTVKTAIIWILPPPNFYINKSVDKEEAYPGDTLSFDLAVWHDGDGIDFNLMIIDSLPQHLQLIPSTLSGDGWFDYYSNPGFIYWDNYNIFSNDTVELHFKAIVDPAAVPGEVVINYAYFPVSKITDSTMTNIIPRPAPHITIDKSVDKPQAYSGDTLTYTLHLQNTGETAVSIVKLQDHLPTYTRPVPGSVTGGGSYDFETESFFWTFESLPAGADLELSFKASIVEDAPEGFIINNYAMIYSPVDVFSDTVYTTIIKSPPVTALRLDKAVDKTSAAPGDTLTYTILVENSGETQIEIAMPMDVLPPYISVIEESITHDGFYDFEAGSISWGVYNLGPSDTITLAFRVEIEASAPTGANLDNFAFTTIPVPAFSDTVRTIITEHQGQPNLTIDKTVNLSQAFPDDTLTYSILVKNEGDGMAENVTVTDDIPAFTYLSGESISHGGVYDSELKQVRWELSSLVPDAETSLSFRAIIELETPDVAVITNMAQAYLGESIVADTVYTDVLPPVEPDILKIVKRVDSLVAARRSIITYDILVTNTSSGYLSGIMVWDTFPTYTSYVAGSATAGGDFDANQNRVVWDWQNINIAPGHTIELSFKAYINPNAPGDHRLNNIAYATLNIPDDIPVKTAAQDTFPSNIVTTIVNIPTGPQDDPVILKEVDLSVAAPGNTLTYNITITNPGPDPINPVIVTDAVPDNTTYVPGSATSGGTYNGIDNRVSWTFGPLAVEETAVLSFQVTIDTDAADNTQIANRASITDPVPVQSNQAVTLVRRDLFLISKSVDRNIVAPGDTVTYGIIYNNGTGAAQDNVVIIDVLETALNYVPGSATGGGVYSAANRSITWNLGNLAAGAIGTLQFRAVVSTSAEDNQQIGNFASATGQSFGPVISQPVFIMVQIPNISLFKEAVPSVAAPGDTIDYSILMGNHESGDLTEVLLIDDIPDGFAYVPNSASISEGVVVVTGTDPLTFDFGLLPSGIGYELTYRLAVPLTADVNEIYTNSAVLHGRDQFGRDIQIGPASAEISLQMPRLHLTKTSGVASGIVGSLIPFTIMVENISDVTFTAVVVTDSMPDGMFYVPGTSLINGVGVANPTGGNPYYWNLGDLESGQSLTLQYTAQLGSSARPGVHENVAWAEGNFGSTPVRTAEAFARVNILPTTIPGAIRGKVVIDCDGDGIPESDDVPVGTDIFLDDGSQSRVNEKGMFYFGTVRPGVRVVALDIRDLEGFYIPEGAEASVFVHVNESGESYVTFRICPMLKIDKKAAMLPKVKVTKAAKLKSTDITDTSGVTIDYEIIIQTNGGALPTLVKVVDSFPNETRLIIHQDQPLVPHQTHNILTYEVTVQEQRMQQSVYYSLEDLSPGIRRFLTNKIYLEGNVSVATEKTEPVFSPPTEVSVGPFKRIPSRDIQLNVVGALFETSKDKLQPEAFPVLRIVADTALQYLDAALRVEGHADYRPIHTREFPSNWELSSARAKAVVDWLVAESGIDSSRIFYEGFAATRPADTGRTAESLQKNRRVEVFIKARQEGGIDLSQITTDRWASATSLELNPVRYDSVFMMPPIPIETGLDDTWEVLLVVENAGNRATAEAIVHDNLPSGVTLNNDQIRVDGHKVTAAVGSNGIIEIRIGPIPANAKVEVRYRVKATEGSIPAGGGRAILTIPGKGETLTRESNSVTF